MHLPMLSDWQELTPWQYIYSMASQGPQEDNSRAGRVAQVVEQAWGHEFKP
jgi:hypothetical protein